MSDITPLPDFGAPPTGAEASPEEPSAEPHWALARATVAQPGLQRDEVAVVDLNDPAIRAKLSHERIELLPADQQPEITTDPSTGQPMLAERSTT